jgi:hypothetical protein
LLVGIHEGIVFEGAVSEKIFRLERLTKNPIVIKGAIEQVGNQTRVKVSMRISWFNVGWLMFAFAFCSFMALAILGSFTNRPIEFYPFLIPISFYSFCLITTIVGFNIEANKATKILQKTLNKGNGAR